MFRDHLRKIISRQNLTETEMAEMMSVILDGKAGDANTGALMAALATKGETFEEVAGAARAMRRKAARIQTPADTVLDAVGTGGDEASTFNISTTTAFVVAGCGVTVAKHGNRSVSSKCGSADVLEVLGVNLNTPPEVVEEAIAEVGIGFLFAPLYHSAMRHAAAARKSIGLRSIFNMLGPLTNPAGANCLLLGVYAPELTEMFAQAARLLGAKRAFAVHGHDGLDEISVCDATRISELNDGMIRTYDVSPDTYFGEPAAPADLVGGDPAENAVITRKILQGEKGPRRNVVLFNAAAGLMAVGRAADFREGITLAKSAIDEGKALEKLEGLIRYTRENA